MRYNKRIIQEKGELIMSETYKLPGSSYEEFVKIIKAYATGKNGVPMTLDTVAQTAGMDKTIVSRNNGFLVQLSLISEGNKKAPTQDGIDLGRAYTLKMVDEIIRLWRNIIEADEFLSRMLSAIKIRNGMEKTSFINHIIYSSGSNNNNTTRAGASTIIEIYKIAGLVQETDGKIVAYEDEEISPVIVSNTESCSNSIPSQPIAKKQVKIDNCDKQIVINININTSVDELDSLSEKLLMLLDSLKQ